jgi:hypothetical protein
MKKGCKSKMMGAKKPMASKSVTKKVMIKTTKK